MKPGMQRSQTAEMAAIARALAAHEADARLRCPDTMARHLIGPYWRLTATIPGIRSLARATYEYLGPGMYLLHTARTRHFDNLFVTQLEEGVKQFVILGAGLDTRGYRFARRLAGATVFEVDHPATGAWKQRRLQGALGQVPGNVVYVAVDFENDSLADRLVAAGLDLSQKVFFLWEGVIMYLTPEAIDRTLAVITAAAPGSTLAFDYCYADVFTNPHRYVGAARLFRYVQARGEPYVFGIDPDDMDDFLRARGLRLLSNLGAVDLARSYLQTSGKPPRYYALEYWGAAHCEVVAPQAH